MAAPGKLAAHHLMKLYLTKASVVFELSFIAWFAAILKIFLFDKFIDVD